MYIIENMARFGFYSQIVLLSFANFVLASNTSLTAAVSQSHRAAGVFLLIEGGKYTFTFSAARAACLFLNVTIATRAQMERAMQRGLETCKFGWTAEQIAVIPRLTSDKNCGQGKTGLATWSTGTDRQFAVYCFNASDLEETKRSTAIPQSSTFSTTQTPPTWTTTPDSPQLKTTTKMKSPPIRKPATPKAPEQTSLTPKSTPLSKTTPSDRISSASTTLNTLPTHIPTSVSHLITSKPTVFSFALSTSVHASNFSVSSQSVMLPSVSPAKSSLGDVPTALIILVIILLLLIAAGVVWYYKPNIYSFWPQGQQKDDIETEMWKHTDSEMDLHSQHEGEDEESDRKYSSDITLCVNPDMKTNPSQ